MASCIGDDEADFAAILPKAGFVEAFEVALFHEAVRELCDGCAGEVEIEGEGTEFRFLMGKDGEGAECAHAGDAPGAGCDDDFVDGS